MIRRLTVLDMMPPVKKENRDFSRSDHAVFLFELVHASAGINKLLFACVERMTLRADFNMEILFRGTRLECFTASTPHYGFAVFRMNTLFHVPTSLFLMRLQAFQP
jgi:hypothetical protein